MLHSTWLSDNKRLLAATSAVDLQWINKITSQLIPVAGYAFLQQVEGHKTLLISNICKNNAMLTFLDAHHARKFQVLHDIMHQLQESSNPLSNINSKWEELSHSLSQRASLISGVVAYFDVIMEVVRLTIDLDNIWRKCVSFSLDMKKETSQLDKVNCWLNEVIKMEKRVVLLTWPVTAHFGIHVSEKLRQNVVLRFRNLNWVLQSFLLFLQSYLMQLNAYQPMLSSLEDRFQRILVSLLIS